MCAVARQVIDRASLDRKALAGGCVPAVARDAIASVFAARRLCWRDNRRCSVPPSGPFTPHQCTPSPRCFANTDLHFSSNRCPSGLRIFDQSRTTTSSVPGDCACACLRSSICQCPPPAARASGSEASHLSIVACMLSARHTATLRLRATV